MNNLILYLIFFIIGIFLINFIKSMCNCNITEGMVKPNSKSNSKSNSSPNPKCDIKSTCDTIRQTCKQINESYVSYNDLVTDQGEPIQNIISIIPSFNGINKDIINTYNNINNYCTQSENFCDDVDKFTSYINNAESSITLEKKKMTEKVNNGKTTIKTAFDKGVLEVNAEQKAAHLALGNALTKIGNLV